MWTSVLNRGLLASFFLCGFCFLAEMKDVKSFFSGRRKGARKEARAHLKAVRLYQFPLGRAALQAARQLGALRGVVDAASLRDPLVGGHEAGEGHVHFV